MKLRNIFPSRNGDVFPKAFECGLRLAIFTHIVFPVLQLYQEARHSIPYNLENLVFVFILK